MCGFPSQGFLRGRERDREPETSMREKHRPAASCTPPTGDVPETKRSTDTREKSYNHRGRCEGAAADAEEHPGQRASPGSWTRPGRSWRLRRAGPAGTLSSDFRRRELRLFCGFTPTFVVLCRGSSRKPFRLSRFPKCQTSPCLALQRSILKLFAI
ncbi:hypothetical protein QTO34_001635 [Cnephaeus nilssonii]|uniref:Uncharacterized protein n=1 Tax=Cnephaeus nilssonii TaxID=3371016 RepID=A0AA40LNT1_CNENI|nr:hypothetical protein QTO34_001635 [Eptesicus nilssonii]